MNFYNYMIRNYKTSDSPAGDLARDMARIPNNFLGIAFANSRDGMTSSIIIWSEAVLAVPALRPLRNAGRNISNARKRN